MDKSLIKLGMLVRYSLPPSMNENSAIGMVVGYPGGSWVHVLWGEKRVMWLCEWCEPVNH